MYVVKQRKGGGAALPGFRLGGLLWILVLLVFVVTLSSPFIDVLLVKTGDPFRKRPGSEDDSSNTSTDGYLVPTKTSDFSRISTFCRFFVFF
jgi:hypothetical protein